MTEYPVQIKWSSNDQCKQLAMAKTADIDGKINNNPKVKIQWNVFEPALIGWNSTRSESISAISSAKAIISNMLNIIETFIPFFRTPIILG